MKKYKHDFNWISPLNKFGICVRCGKRWAYLLEEADKSFKNEINQHDERAPYLTITNLDHVNLQTSCISDEEVVIKTLLE